MPLAYSFFAFCLPMPHHIFYWKPLKSFYSFLFAILLHMNFWLSQETFLAIRFGHFRQRFGGLQCLHLWVCPVHLATCFVICTPYGGGLYSYLVTTKNIRLIELYLGGWTVSAQYIHHPSAHIDIQMKVGRKHFYTMRAKHALVLKCRSSHRNA